jgi:hypothetical protein
MTGVMLGQGVVPMLLFVVHGHVRPISGSGCRGWGPRGSRLDIGLHMSLGQGGSTPRVSSAPMLTLSGSDALMTS